MVVTVRDDVSDKAACYLVPSNWYLSTGLAIDLDVHSAYVVVNLTIFWSQDRKCLYGQVTILQSRNVFAGIVIRHMLLIWR